MKKIILLSAILLASVFSKSQTSTKVGQDTTAKLLRQVRTSLQTGTLNTISRTTTVSALPSNTTNLATSALQTTGNTAINGVRTDIQTLQTITAIGPQNTNGQNTKYTCSFSVTPAAACTDLVYFFPGNGVVRTHITKILISGFATTATLIPVTISAKTASNTGGTSTAKTSNNMQYNGAASTCTVLAYTANPTINGSLFILRSQLLSLNTSASGICNPLEFDFGGYFQYESSTQPWFGISINLNSSTITGGVLYITFLWDETVYPL